MTHNEKRASWVRETAIGLGVGVLYGLTSVVVGQPLDTTKTKMQAQQGYEKGGMMKTVAQIMRTDGPLGFYRGSIPPLLGSGIFRSVQFAMFEGAYTLLGSSPSVDSKEIPFTFGLQWRVVLAGIASGSMRALMECPVEYVKINLQVGQSWRFRLMFTGLGMTLARSVPLLTSYFIMIDSFRRHFPNMFSTTFGQFVMAAGSSTAAWWIVWPLEVVKVQVQASTPVPGTPAGKKPSVFSRLAHMGIRGIYRGILPGTIRSVVSNGCSMIVMQWAQREATKLGMRN